MDVNSIMRILPHRYPFLLVDRIVEMDPGKRAVGLKNLTFNEEFFQGHFPGHPVMPGVLILESMAQVAGILSFMASGDLDEAEKAMQDKVVYFMSIDKVKFRKPVVPGDQLKNEIVITRQRGNIAQFEARGYVDGELVAEAEMKAMLIDRQEAADSAGEGK
jgi:3-hydroxyacyl-[acyl-carrier-protein] dehydratase